VTRRSGKKRSRQQLRAEFKTLADVGLVRQAVRKGWATTTGNQNAIIADLFEMIRHPPDFTDRRSIRRGQAASKAFLEMDQV